MNFPRTTFASLATPGCAPENGCTRGGADTWHRAAFSPSPIPMPFRSAFVPAMLQSSLRAEVNSGAVPTQITLDHLWMQWGFESLRAYCPLDARSQPRSSDVHCRFAAASDENRRWRNGERQPRRIRQGFDQHRAKRGGKQMGRDVDLACRPRSCRRGNRRARAHLSDRYQSRCTTVPAMGRLRALHAQAIALAKRAHNTFMTPAVAKAIEQEHARSLVEALAAGSTHQSGGGFPDSIPVSSTDSSNSWRPGQTTPSISLRSARRSAPPSAPCGPVARKSSASARCAISGCVGCIWHGGHCWLPTRR